MQKLKKTKKVYNFTFLNLTPIMAIRFFSLVFIFLASIQISAQLETAEYSIKNLIINTPYTDMSVSFWGKGRVFYASSKNAKVAIKEKVEMSNDKNKAFLEIFSAFIAEDYELVYSKKANFSFNVNFNQSNVTFSPDLEYVYFTSNDEKGRGEKEVVLKIYRAKVQKTGLWTDLEELSFNSERYNCAHPTISDDGTKLYFASDMPGGYGDTDLYYVDIYADGKVGQPQNLGGYVNSAAKESFPDINGGLLYFSSNRKGGLGGLDIYMVPTGNLFIDPVNLKEPINSKYDDFSFVINGDTRRGYFTSNRPQGKGADDIYSFVQETAIKSCSQMVEIEVLDAKTNFGVDEAEINIFDEEGKWLNKFVADEDGKYKIKFNKCNKNYKIEATKKYYSKDFAKVIYDPNKESHQLRMRIVQDVLAMQQEKKNPTKVVSDIPDNQLTLNVKTIEFLLNKYDLEMESLEELDKVVKFMKEHPTVIVEFSSHTDSRGPDEWNMELTNLRAQEVVQYIVGKGIDYRRIYGKGYGESMPVNHCTNGVECSDAEHLKNRRTEFLILAK